MAADPRRVDAAIEAPADSLLSICAVQTGTDPAAAVERALAAIEVVMWRAEREQRTES